MLAHLAVKSLRALVVLAVVAVVTPVRAQLLLSGTTSGEFADPSLAHTTVTNTSSVSLFASGVPYRPLLDTPSSIQFTGALFDGIGDGGRLDLGLLNLKNGITRLHTTAGSATMDLYLNLPAFGISDFKLTSLYFTIDNTSNHGAHNFPDLFFIGHSAVNFLHADGRTVTFDLQLTNPAFGLGSGASISENRSGSDGLYAFVHFSPVPEPAAYALFGALLLVGVVVVRRARAHSLVA